MTRQPVSAPAATRRPPVGEARSLRPPVWTEEEVEMLVAARAGGRRMACLAREIGRSESAIAAKARELGLPPLKRGRRAGLAPLPKLPPRPKVEAKPATRSAAARASGVAGLSRGRLEWTEAEREQLKSARLSAEVWPATLARFPSRTGSDVRTEWWRMVNADPALRLAGEKAAQQARDTSRRNAFKAAEDKALARRVKAVQDKAKGGEIDWAVIAEGMPGRDEASVRRRAYKLGLAKPVSRRARAEAASAAKAWTPGDEAVLREVLEKGYSAATAMARLDHHDRGEVRERFSALRRERSESARRRADGPLATGPAIAGADPHGSGASLALAPRECKWPIGDPGAPDFHHCRAPASAGPYCDAHRRGAVQSASRRRKKRAAQTAEDALAALDRMSEARVRRGLR